MPPEELATLTTFTLGLVDCVLAVTAGVSLRGTASPSPPSGPQPQSHEPQESPGSVRHRHHRGGAYRRVLMPTPEQF